MIEPMFQTKIVEQNDTFGKFVFEPMHPSFANSIGNALRRTLLSSIRGAAVGYVKIAGAEHLFSTVTGVKESVLDMVLNLKQVHFILENEGPARVTLNVKGPGKVYAESLEGEAKVVTTNQYIAEITDDVSLEIEAIIESGYGFIASEEKEDEPAGFITVDSSFSPIERVNFAVEEARVGRKSNFERLIFEVWTNGSITPEDAIRRSVDTLSRYINHVFASSEETAESRSEGSQPEMQESSSNDTKYYDTIIDELNLPSRVINALLRENIETVGDLVNRGKENLVGLKGVGRKSIDLVEDELKKMNIKL